VPEGIAAVWAREAHSGPAGQGLIMAAHPIGVAIGGVVVGRLLAPSTRRKLIRPLSMVVPLVLIGALFNPPLPVVVAIAAVGGLAMSGVLAPSNGLFVQVLPEAYRARSFGVMQGGLQIAQGAAVFITGAIVGWWTLPPAVAPQHRPVPRPLSRPLSRILCPSRHGPGGPPPPTPGRMDGVSELASEPVGTVVLTHGHAERSEVAREY